MIQPRSLFRAPKRLLLLLALVACVCTSKSQAEPKLDKILADDSSVALTRISTVKSLIAQVQSKSGDDKDKFKDSLLQLEPILTQIQSGDICNLAMTDKIKSYHGTFIAEGATKAIPVALKRFFVSLGFQLSAECKMALINNLEYDTKEAINPQDYDEIHFLERYGATLLNFDDAIYDFDDIILLSDFLSASPSADHDEGPVKLVVKTRTNSLVRQLVKKCELKFKPFYEKLILPLIQLSNMGYNYQGELLERELKELKNNDLVRRWYNIVQTCEAFAAFDIYEDKESSSVSSNEQVLTFISPEEAEMLRRQQHEKTIEAQVMDGEEAKPIEYEPVASHNDDELWIKSQKELDKLVKNYRNDITSASRIRSQILRKFYSKVKKFIMSGKVHLAVSELLTCSARKSECETSNVDVKQDLISMVDEAVIIDEQEQAARKGAVSLDQQVAGHGSKIPMRSIGLPSRVAYQPPAVDGSKTSTKFFNGFLARFFPSKWDILFFYVGVIGIIFCFLGFIVMLGG